MHVLIWHVVVNLTSLDICKYWLCLMFAIAVCTCSLLQVNTSIPDIWCICPEATAWESTNAKPVVSTYVDMQCDVSW